MEATIEHKGLGVRATVKALKQRDVEVFSQVLISEEVRTASQRRGANLRAAIQAGWFTELTPAMTVESVADQAPAVVRLLGEWIEAVYAEVTTVPPE